MAQFDFDAKAEGWSTSWMPLPKPAPSPFASAERLAQIALRSVEVTEEDVQSFEKKGYWMAPKMLEDEDIELLRKEANRVFEGKVDRGSTPYEYEYWKRVVSKHQQDLPDVLKVNNAWWVNDAVKKVVLSPAIGEAAAKLLRTNEIRLWHDQVIAKPGLGPDGHSENAGNIGWHQDYGFWQVSNSSSMITAWIALQDTDLSNGGLRTITGSHKWGLLPDSATFFEKDLDSLQAKFSAFGDQWSDEPSIMKAGQTRYAIAVHMQSEHVGFQSGRGWHSNVRDLGPNLQEGDLFVGPAFPVLWRRS
ncbi:PhytanoylCoA dioxygenase (PhyH) superfamily protein [Acanthamoeba castellanii str. Neff]|uniref:PhytanoylCoA dioxygenase (PhyH) superfamily protein n=1 Tax=Acanthamoeba castellanii (strain ATCC 30010 / Neff) TaxID=1257118 RepID=L8HCD0_ACACF|nr:PhytanoylCoA dioxygenase (PhyH) superfamily protein [Acanthamoeba castellanii str. Neff]ELR23174.1 PhytanoylCoA dioxygenase (PhyH) superfamily protein [Acanthamoeba castellanii str. Neff]